MKPNTTQKSAETVPGENDVLIDGTYTSDAIWAQVQLATSRGASVLFFRYQGEFYMRVVAGA